MKFGVPAFFATARDKVFCTFCTKRTICTNGLLPNKWIDRSGLIIRYGIIGRASEICGGVATVSLAAAGAIQATGTNIIFEGAKGTRIFQMRWQNGGKPIFRFDYGSFNGKGPTPHYHRPPNLDLHKPFEGGW